MLQDGAFTTIVQSFCDENYAIFGVEFNNQLHANHTYTFNKNDIDRYRKSKYVQSSIGNSYNEAKRFLEEGKKVLFTGTPCQIAGLKKFLNKEYDNLLTVDIVCHGVPSQKVLDKYLDFMKNKYSSKIKNISFREKIKESGKWNSRCMKIEFMNGKSLIENSQKNLYLRGFHSKLFYQTGCYQCKYANPNRISDITIADCWGIEKINKEWDVHQGVSMIVLNTEKGKKLLEGIKKECEVIPLDLEFAVKENSQFREPTKMNNKREYFFQNIDTIKFNRLINECVPQNKIKTIISKLFSSKIKAKIKEVIGGK